MLNMMQNKHNLYLIQSGDKIKIGYTSDIPSRMGNYRTHNPNFKLLNTYYRIDAKLFEKKLHKKYKEFRQLEWYDITMLNKLKRAIKQWKIIILK